MPQPHVAAQQSEKRVNNFNEVSLGFSRKIATEEARRCLQCQSPLCVDGCPIGVDIPAFVRQVRDGNLNGAYQVIRDTNPLPAICGRICSAQCESQCVLKDKDGAIAIRALERFAADFGRTRMVKPKLVDRTAKKIAIIGSGPTGLSAAFVLSQRGFSVTIFESFDRAGGMLRYGVPEFRVPKKILDSEINDIRSLDVKLEMNCLVGRTFTLDELFNREGYHAVLLATGAAVPRFLDVPGVNLGGVYYGEEFLMRVNLMKTGIFSRYIPNFVIGSKILVVGSGNTALDCARSAVRLGREVHLIFKATEDDMRVRSIEREYAKEEGVKMESLARPVEIIGGPDNFVKTVKCVRMDYAQLDKKGNWTLDEVPGSEFEIEADTVIVAIGHKPNGLLAKLCPGLEIAEDGTIEVDEDGLTTLNRVYAAGNVVSNARPFIDAVASGMLVAESMAEKIN
ncbi:MAG: NAD(P)-dependent oxidoreductase [Candidatus Omnitrophica bacterium]|nr:NAD(P)-dependent oxidoreductase [Candidatus Omnitrophota bacterium]